jgi:hypothetical protein
VSPFVLGDYPINLLKLLDANDINLLTHNRPSRPN